MTFDYEKLGDKYLINLLVTKHFPAAHPEKEVFKETSWRMKSFLRCPSSFCLTFLMFHFLRLDFFSEDLGMLSCYSIEADGVQKQSNKLSL